MDPAQKNMLLNCKKSKEDTSFRNMQVYAKCIDIYDGDTCRLKFFYRGEITQCSVRLLGIDTPEIRPIQTAGRTSESVTREKISAQSAKEALSKLILGRKLVYVVFGANDKYGRPLVTLYTDENKISPSINQMLLNDGHAKAYGGQKRDIHEPA